MSFSICVSDLVKSLEDRCATLIDERDALEAELSSMPWKRGRQGPAPDHPSRKACEAAEKKKDRKRRKKLARKEEEASTQGEDAFWQREAKHYEGLDDSV